MGVLISKVRECRVGRTRTSPAGDVRVRPTRHFRTFEMRTPMENTIHFVLQAKGGIGKSFVSTLLAQYLLNETGAVRCFDTDQENTTFAHYAALSVSHITLTD